MPLNEGAVYYHIKNWFLRPLRPYTKDASFCYFECQKKQNEASLELSMASEAAEAVEARFIRLISSALKWCKGQLHAKF